MNLAERIPAKRGGRWYPGTVRYILDKPNYQGYVEYYFRWNGERYVIKEGQHKAVLPKVS
ncbi:MAG: recombinase family protein [Firmicutes bacterium]|nr:recombinase family protein [Bacillota bacterium]